MESSTASRAGEDGIDGASSMEGRSGRDIFRTRIFCEMRACEKPDVFGGGGPRYSVTVARTAWVISSLDP